MSIMLHTIRLPLPFRLGTVNAYLLQESDTFALIDTGSSFNQAGLLARLRAAGCHPGSLRIILLTHGDFDHTGSAAALRSQFHAPLAMHRADWAMAERGDMFANRRKRNRLIGRIAPALFRFQQDHWFTPDLALTMETDLTPYGFDLQVIPIPGHSQGSVGLLTRNGDLFCGDLLVNHGAPALNSLMDSPLDAQASIVKLSGLPISLVYPGHGDPFPFARFLDTWKSSTPTAHE